MAALHRLTARASTRAPSLRTLRRSSASTAWLAASPARSRLVIAPEGWLGPRGNFAPAQASDPFLQWPRCEETLFTSPPGLINLDTGAPCAHLLSQAQQVLLAGVEHWHAQPRSITSMQYGPVEGTGAFRRALAQFLSTQYAPHGAGVSPDSLLQTSGATHGLALALQVFFGRAAPERKMVFIEDPTYFLAPKMFAEQGFQLTPVPLRPNAGGSTDGIDLE